MLQHFRLHIIQNRLKKHKHLLSLMALCFLTQLQTQAQVFTSSTLPIVIITTDNNAPIGDINRVLGNMKIIDNGPGNINYLTDQNNATSLNYNGRIDIEIRGSYSQNIEKKGYGLTTLKSDNSSNNNVILLGMPKENDWVLNSLAYDPALVRDFVSYGIARNMGNYAPRTAYCELMINGNYRGIYLLQEKIKADNDRVNITKILTTQNTLPELSGGYITKCDKNTGGDPIAWIFPAYAPSENPNFIHELPKASEVTSQQNSYIYNQFLNLASTTASSNSSLLNGYPSIIDVPSFVDFMLCNELASNVDAYQFSTYFHKDRNGKLRAGPIWDLNLSYGNDLFDIGFDRSKTNIWQFANGDNDGAKFWKDLFLNNTYKCYLAKRWYEVSQPGMPMNSNSINTLIDSAVNLITPALQREQTRWNKTINLTLEINNIKTFVSARTTWLNNNVGSYAACAQNNLPKLVISKINYNPIASINYASDELEFIEISNNSVDSVNLTGIYFGGLGLAYTFPANAMLAGNTSIYLASNAAAFKSQYGFNPFGAYERILSNNNQDLILLDGFGNLIDQVHYFDAAPWNTLADGGGYYLQLSNINSDNNLANNWIASNVKISVGIQQLESQLQLYPNPSNGLLQLVSSYPVAKINLTDMQGLILKQFEPASQTNNTSIDIQNYSSGIYLLQITFSNGYILNKKIGKF